MSAQFLRTLQDLSERLKQAEERIKELADLYNDFMGMFLDLRDELKAKEHGKRPRSGN